jgi:hypothetical protein
MDQNLVSMYKALGGGWQIREGKDYVPEDIRKEMIERINWGDLLSVGELEYPPSEESRAWFHRPDW